MVFWKSSSDLDATGQEIEEQIFSRLAKTEKATLTQNLEEILKRHPLDLTALFVEDRIQILKSPFVIKLAKVCSAVQSQSRLFKFIKELPVTKSRPTSIVFVVQMLCSSPKKNVAVCLESKLANILEASIVRAVKAMAYRQEGLSANDILLLRGPWGVPFIPLLKHLLKNSSSEVKKAIIITLNSFEEERESTLPAFLGALGDSKGDICKMAASALANIGEASLEPLLEVLKTGDTRKKSLAVWSLGKIGIVSPEVVTALLEALESSEEKVRRPAAWALENLESNVSPELISRFSQTNQEAQVAILEILVKTPPISSEIIDILISSLEQENLEIRKASLQASILVSEEEGKTLLPILLSLAKSIEEDLKPLLSLAIGAIAPENNEEVIEVLNSWIKDPSPLLRKNTAQSLGRAAFASPLSAQNLVKLLSDTSSEVRLAAIRSLAQFTIPLKSAVFPLMGLLQTPEKEILISTIQVITNIGKAAEEAIPLLAKLLAHPDLKIRAATSHALIQMGELSIPALISLLQGKLEVRKLATIILVQIGSPAIPSLKQALLGNNFETRKAACEALSKIGEPAVPSLISVLKEGNFWTRKSVSLALINIKVGVPEQLIELMCSPNRDWQEIAVPIYRKIDTYSLSCFILMLVDKKKLVSDFGAKMLRKVGPAHEVSIPNLVTLVDHSNKNVRRATCWAFGRIGKVTDDVLEALDRALEDDDIAVSMEAQDSLDKLVGKTPLNDLENPES